ncbi:MAG: SDR family oxidoreductase [Vulcanimicrobiaceae bacterium]
MHVLILGGTRFLGRHLVNALVARAHRVTLFNSGNNREQAPAGVEQIHGNRDTDLSLLDGRRWDAVIDTCGYFPGQLEASTRALRGRAGRYIFISSVSALDLTNAHADENTATLPLPPDASLTETAPEMYGPLKAACERVVRDAFGHRALNVRPGLIAGPYDPTDRFTYWPARVARGGTLLAPCGRDYFVQFIDARDLAAWIVLQAEIQTSGDVNVTGPAHEITFGDVLLSCAQVAGTQPQIVWASEKFLKQNGVAEWTDLPLWISDESALPAMRNVSISRATATGLQIRPLRETANDTLQWSQTRDQTYDWKAGLAPEREAQLLERLR